MTKRPSQVSRFALSAFRDRMVSRRTPDVAIGGPDDPYMLRWWVIPRNRWFNIYLHCFKRSDDDRALHDHPWWNVSILIEGSYVEHTPGKITRREAPAFVFRRAKAAHRIDLDAGDCWSLFLTGPRIRDWGFHCPKGWVHWRIFTDPLDGGATVGRGCGDDQ